MSRVEQAKAQQEQLPKAVKPAVALTSDQVMEQETLSSKGMEIAVEHLDSFMLLKHQSVIGTRGLMTWMLNGIAIEN